MLTIGVGAGSLLFEFALGGPADSGDVGIADMYTFGGECVAGRGEREACREPCIQHIKVAWPECGKGSAGVDDQTRTGVCIDGNGPGVRRESRVVRVGQGGGDDIVIARALRNLSRERFGDQAVGVERQMKPMLLGTGAERKYDDGRGRQI